MKNILKGAVPFLLGVAVTLGVQMASGSCCKGVSQQMENVEKLLQDTKKIASTNTKRLDKLVAELPEEKAKAAEKAAAKAKAEAEKKVKAEAEKAAAPAKK